MAPEKKTPAKTPAKKPAPQKVVSLTEKQDSKDSYDIYRRFMMRPAKYDGTELVLTIKLLTSENRGGLRADLCKVFGLKAGDAMYTMAYVEEPRKGGPVFGNKKVAVFAQGAAADWLEDMTTDIIIKARVKLSFRMLREVEGRGDNSLVVDNMYARIILLEVLEKGK